MVCVPQAKAERAGQLEQIQKILEEHEVKVVVSERGRSCLEARMLHPPM